MHNHGYPGWLSGWPIDLQNELHAMKQLNCGDIVIEPMWCGPDKGAALRIRHLPTGVFVARVIGFEPAWKHSRHLKQELCRLVHEFQKSDDNAARIE